MAAGDIATVVGFSRGAAGQWLINLTGAGELVNADRGYRLATAEREVGAENGDSASAALAPTGADRALATLRDALDAGLRNA